MHKVNFVHLRVHSDYSIIDGLYGPEKLIDHAIYNNMVSIGLTDLNNFHGVIKFYRYSCSMGIKPIIGVDIQISSIFEKNKFFKLTLLAKNNLGYKNITSILSDSYQHGYSKDIGLVINQKTLIKYRSGIIILSGDMKGDVGKCILRNDYYFLEKYILYYKKYFFNNYYLEISRIGISQEEVYIERIKKISLIYSLPIVATNQVYFLKKEDFEVHKIRVAIYFKKTISDPKFIYNYTKEQFLKSISDMCNIFSDIPEALINTIEISKRCNVIIRSGKSFLPIFSTGKLNISEFFVLKSFEGLKKRLKNKYPEKNERKKFKKIYYDRLSYEISIISKMGFISYFLIVMEFIQWSKFHDIPVGPGRGSGSGSLVAYSLNITELDPLHFNLLFERFLNPYRVSLPDFDIDFCMEKRDLVIEHVSEKYGRNSVAQIITFGTMTAKAVIRDVGRVLGYPYGFVNRISKLIPLDIGITLDKAFTVHEGLLKLYEQNVDVKRLIDISKKLEGVVRNSGKHAGGVVISPTKITDFCPLLCDDKGQNQITQFDKNDIEYIGLVKFDFLGLKTLTIINSSVKMINKKRRMLKKSEICINNIDFFDKKSFRMLKKSETISVFQLESIGMRDLLRRLQPDSFEDIIALIALFRPGPLQSGMVDNFINRKIGIEKISYPDHKWQHNLLIPILKPTYGIILYQEQVMQIAQVLSGYSPGEADILRRAMVKKKSSEMADQRYFFQNGAKKNGISLNLSTKIFDLLEKFSSYGFNKSHSTAYAFLAYQTLWLKANYTAEFMASAMNSDLSDTKKIVVLIKESKRMNVKILAPNINESNYFFCVNNDSNIIYGLGAIKGLGKSSIDLIIKERKNKKKPFKNFLDLCIRVYDRCLTKRVLERLIMSGSCDVFKVSRLVLFNSIEETMKTAKQYLLSVNLKQNSLFYNLKDKCHYNINVNTKKIFFQKKYYDFLNLNIKYLNWEYETLGMYFSGHPISIFLNELRYYTNNIMLKDCNFKNNKKYVLVSGMIFSLKKHYSKNKKKIYSIILDDSNDYLDLVLFDNLNNDSYKFLKKDVIIIVYGYLSFNSFRGSTRLIVKEICDLENIRRKLLNFIKVKIDFNKNSYDFNKINSILMNLPKGNTKLFFLNINNTIISYKNVSYKWKIDPLNKSLSIIKSIFYKEKIFLSFFKKSIFNS